MYIFCPLPFISVFCISPLLPLSLSISLSLFPSHNRCDRGNTPRLCWSGVRHLGRHFTHTHFHPQVSTRQHSVFPDLFYIVVMALVLLPRHHVSPLLSTSIRKDVDSLNTKELSALPGTLCRVPPPSPPPFPRPLTFTSRG
jgi:hypothetical protein